MIIVNALFGIEGDNVFFRGFDYGRRWNGYECPLFDIKTAYIVARYISTQSRDIRYDKDAETFRIIVSGDEKQYLIRRKRFEIGSYFDFGGTARWIKG